MTASTPRTSLDPAAPRIGSENHIRVENRDQSLEVPVARRREERLDDLSLSIRVGVGHGVLRPHAATGAARELTGRLGGAIDDRRDLVEGHGEDVVEHEREPLGGAQRLEHHQQRETDGVGQQCLVLGVGAVRAVDDRLRDVHVERLFAPRPA